MNFFNKKIFFAGFVICICLISCEKEGAMNSLNSKQLIDEAKNWYLNQQVNKEIAMYGSNKSMKPLRFTPDWDAVQIDNIEGKKILSIPIITNLNKLMGSDHKFSLVIKEQANQFEARTVSYRNISSMNDNLNLSIKELFQSAYYPAEVSKTIKDAEIRVFDLKFKNLGSITYRTKNSDLSSNNFIDHKPTPKLEDIRKNVKSPEKTMNIPLPPEGCRLEEWYYVYTEYDEEGVIIYQDISFAYYEVICPTVPGNGSPGGGVTGGEPGSEDINRVIGADATSQNISTLQIENNGATRKKLYTWKFFENVFGLWSISSEEIGVHYFDVDSWWWQSLSHSKTKLSGILLGSVITTSVTGIPEVNPTYSKMQLSYSVSISMVWKGAPVSANYVGNVNSPLWTVND